MIPGSLHLPMIARSTHVASEVGELPLWVKHGHVVVTMMKIVEHCDGNSSSGSRSNLRINVSSARTVKFLEVLFQSKVE
jgi:hypothetical protein